MKDYEKNIRIIEIINPSFRKKELNNHNISQTVEKIKAKYRDKYCNKVNNYFYDIIIHIGDNYSHIKEIGKVLDNLYLNLK